MLKSLIAKHLNVCETKQELRYAHKRCSSASQIGQLKIKNGDKIELIELSDDQIDANNVIMVTLKFEDAAKYTLHCSNTMSVGEFKKEVFAKVPVVPINEQILYFNGTELMDMNATLREYGMKHNCVVDFEWKQIEIHIE